MLKKRLIPKLLIDSKKMGEEEIAILVTTKGYKKRIAVGDPVSQAKIYEANFADELILTDISGKNIDENALFIGLLDKLSQEIFMPICVGGGVSKLEHCEKLLHAGCDKVSINSSLLNDIGFVKNASKNFGAQCVVGSVDFCMVNDNPVIFNWKLGAPTEIHLSDFCNMLQDHGVGELHLCDIQRDGFGIGLNYKVFCQISKILEIPLIISGGVGTADDFVEGFQLGGADAVAAGTYFCLRDQSPIQARSHVKTAGIPIRI
jgi:imidazole glycerol-phosphate synthase subunit HisF